MDISTFQSIQTKIKTLEQKKARDEGAIETILENWKTSFSVTTIEEAEALLASLQTQLDEINTQAETFFTELKGLTQWSLV